MGKWGLTGATIVTPDETIKNAGIAIQGDKIERVSGGPVRGVDAFDAGDTVLAPGLINAHDHLLGTYYPKVGNGPYENWLPWDNDLKSALVYEERQQIE
ncbi:MAG TPA: hydrolase, partial [Spirochaetota bacterium]|nr:hydrolase [Spirochaetota bacterium]